MYYTVIMAKKMELKSHKRMLQSPLKLPAPERIYTHNRQFSVTKLKTRNLQFLGEIQLEEIQKDVENRYGFG